MLRINSQLMIRDNFITTNGCDLSVTARKHCHSKMNIMLAPIQHTHKHVRLVTNSHLII